ncbi:MAG: hypothetical protein ABSF64_11240 [Bryobacteraceae bacterium]
MTFCNKLLALAAALPGLAAAADPDMMKLVMPDASMVMEVNIAKIMASPIGSAMREAVHQGVASQVQAKLAQEKPELQERIALLTSIDWSQQVQDVVLAGGAGKSAPALIIVRTSLDPARIQALKAFTGNMTEYQGVPILVSDKPGNGVFAFLDNSIVLVGQMADVQSAIRRRGQHAALPAALAAQVARYSGYDIWAAQAGILPQPLSGSAAASPAEAKVAEFLAKVAGFNGGLRLSPDFDLSADIEARTEKGAAEMAEGLRSLTSMARSQVRNANQGVSGLEGFRYHVNGKHVMLALHVPEEQMRAGLRQMRATPAGRMAVAARQAPPASISTPPSSGLPPPPAGTIRVQSAEGTTLIPVGKDQ